MAATHNAFTIIVLALDNFEVIRPTELSTIIPNKNEKGEAIEDYAKLRLSKTYYEARSLRRKNTTNFKHSLNNVIKTTVTQSTNMPKIEATVAHTRGQEVFKG